MSQGPSKFVVGELCPKCGQGALVDPDPERSYTLQAVSCVRCMNAWIVTKVPLDHINITLEVTDKND